MVAGVFCLTSCRTVPEYHSGNVAIFISLHDQQAQLYKGKHVVASSRISTGREGHNTPVGHFKVIQKDADHRSSVYGYYADASGHLVKENIDVRKDSKPLNAHFVGASMPFFMEFRPGYGLHKGYLPGNGVESAC